MRGIVRPTDETWEVNGASVFVYCLETGKVLSIDRKNTGNFGIISGGSEYIEDPQLLDENGDTIKVRESFLETAIREFREETGLVVDERHFYRKPGQEAPFQIPIKTKKDRNVCTMGFIILTKYEWELPDFTSTDETEGRASWVDPATLLCESCKYSEQNLAIIKYFTQIMESDHRVKLSEELKIIAADNERGHSRDTTVMPPIFVERGF